MHMRGNKAHRVNLIAASDTQSLRNNCTHTPPSHPVRATTKPRKKTHSDALSRALAPFRPSFHLAETERRMNIPT